MSKVPDIKQGEWITVGTTSCVIKNVYQEGTSDAVCLVVFDEDKPTTHDVSWDGENWVFSERSDYGGYGRNDDKYVQQLKHGRYS